MYASYEPYIKDSDDWLAKVCQVSLFFSLVSSIALKVEQDSSTEALSVLLLFTLAVPPVTAFFFESGLDFEKGCYISYIRKQAINCFTITLGRCFDRCFREKGVVRVGTEESCTTAAKVSDQEPAAKLERSSRASSSESVAEEYGVSPAVHDVSPTREVQAFAVLRSETASESVAVTVLE
mmetsp:Transcript_55527/g.133014  ORF Transcript_55527/g.133014 Transcript_55527/m.133014 type:complete len:180 (-) Transcript_55527:188-727(-)